MFPVNPSESLGRAAIGLAGITDPSVNQSLRPGWEGDADWPGPSHMTSSGYLG